MIDVTRATSVLQQFYPDLEMVSDRVFRAFDQHDGNAYAVRYYDLNDDLISTAERLRDYQDSLLGTHFFDPNAGSDLRWNHYLYFITSGKVARQSEFSHARILIESNSEYARKLVVMEDELEHALNPHMPRALAPQQLPPDLVSIWMDILDEKRLGFVLDDEIQVPEVSRRIVAGKLQRSRKSMSVSELGAAEIEVSQDIISKLTIKGFRNYPTRREFDFSEVNLIVGVNAVGKTSLLEAIEYLYCGKTKRSDRLLRGTAVSAMLQRSGLLLETGTKTDKKKLQARHLAWYGKAELNKLSIDETFGKFNFLDTDAAGRLTVEKSKERISQDVAQLLLGAQVGKSLDRLKRVHRELSETCKSLDKDINLRKLQQRETKDRLDVLLNVPQEADQLFSEFLIVLDRLQWKEQPQNKLTADTLSSALHAAKTEADTLQLLKLPLTVLAEPTLVSSCRCLVEAINTSKDYDKQEVEIREQRIQVERQLTPLLERVAAIEALKPFVTSGLQTLLLRRNALSFSIGARTSALASAKAAEAFSPDKELRIELVRDAVAANRTRLFELREQAAIAKRTLEDYEKTQAEIAALRQQLRNTAQNILSQAPDPDHCPLCHTLFQPGELLEQILSHIDTAEEKMSSELRIGLQASERAVTEACSQAMALEGLEAFVGPDIAAGISVEDTLKRITNEREQLDSELDELKTSEVRLRELSEGEFTEIRLNELKARAQIQSSLPPLLGLDTLIDSLMETVEIQRQQIALLEENLHNLEDNCAALAREHGIEVPLSVDALNQQLNAKLNIHKRALQAVRVLEKMMQLPSVVNPIEILVQLDQAQSLLVRLKTSIAHDLMVVGESSKETKNLKEHTDMLEVLSVQRQNIMDAHAILSGLLNNHSEKTLSEQILRENGDEIASTFACIHVPNEFDLKTEASGLRIVRRDGEHEVDLNEMSTGQRAAYALSLFLAMNARLQRGPKILLFDDPIAHVDDINVLSFLDHLRELALKGTRQIFFATADNQLAGLFRHKFRFLGENRFREITLTREG